MKNSELLWCFGIFGGLKCFLTSPLLSLCKLIKHGGITAPFADERDQS